MVRMSSIYNLQCEVVRDRPKQFVMMGMISNVIDDGCMMRISANRLKRGVRLGIRRSIPRPPLDRENMKC